jgi:hypothetical protein
MMLTTLVDNDRYRRRQLRMIIRPLSDEFIHGSPESLPRDCYRIESGPADPSHIQATKFRQKG